MRRQKPSEKQKKNFYWPLYFPIIALFTLIPSDVFFSDNTSGRESRANNKPLIDFDFIAPSECSRAQEDKIHRNRIKTREYSKTFLSLSARLGS